MARRTLGLGPDVEPTVTGGLTFFGAPLNTYMTHAACAMVRRLRGGARLGLLYGQGGFVTKHHALVVSRDRRPKRFRSTSACRPKPIVTEVRCRTLSARLRARARWKASPRCSAATDRSSMASWCCGQKRTRARWRGCRRLM